MRKLYYLVIAGLAFIALMLVLSYCGRHSGGSRLHQPLQNPYSTVTSMLPVPSLPKPHP